ncbi:MAG TPA: energy-coupling factor ABC transporter ATP-binding protein [Anaerolineae bacterium]|nr:energy-coupling factor ABC transporter ATP-binding protein [Anaerolineae bacterium]
MNAITIQNLKFSYPQAIVLHDLSLTVQPGEHIGVIGANGVGKTTLFHTICGILKPTSGTIQLFGQPVKTGQFHPQVGLVFQYPDDQLFAPTVWDDVAFGPLNMGLPMAAVEERVTQALTETKMLSFKDRAPHHLSGGQKRMVAIAGIRAMQPDLVLYDEPSANLDMRSRRQLITFIKNSPETVLVSSHDLELILEVSQRVILIDDGQIIADGDPTTIMGDDTLMEKHGLERPHSLRPHIHAPQAEPHTH